MKVAENFIQAKMLTQGEKAAALIMRSQHMSHAEIAAKLSNAHHKVSAESISNFLTKMRKLAETTGLDYDFKEDLKQKAIDAVKDGLDCPADPYKRGTLGVNVLKGVGVFTPDTTQVNVLNMINSVPPDMKDRYITLEGERNEEAQTDAAGR